MRGSICTSAKRAGAISSSTLSCRCVCPHARRRRMVAVQSEGEVPDLPYASSSAVDWREYRARLVALEKKKTEEAAPALSPRNSLWAHAIPTVEVGAVLLAHPLMFSTAQTYFKVRSPLVHLPHQTTYFYWPGPPRRSPLLPARPRVHRPGRRHAGRRPPGPLPAGRHRPLDC